ncbi:hypothetical protein F5148DRAFT_604971 [Russula earlei]|uniref:Uncharacterized protein n=1 Tax=Russula earlei TaxID=71964 RepID=A0ACC0UEZ4_9AGAM|nr:hypothetical protein F5148DRAFT_604971 [Russula earlei]
MLVHQLPWSDRKRYRYKALSAASLFPPPPSIPSLVRAQQLPPKQSAFLILILFLFFSSYPALPSGAGCSAPLALENPLFLVAFFFSGHARRSVHSRMSTWTRSLIVWSPVRV